jgi:hypothetical protein
MTTSMMVIMIAMNMETVNGGNAQYMQCGGTRPAHCGSCYGAGGRGQCCNSCQDVVMAYAKRKMIFPGPEKILICAQKWADFPKISSPVSIPIEKVPCRAEPKVGVFQLSDDEACNKWRYMMYYNHLEHLKCKPVVTSSGQMGSSCEPNFFRQRGVETYVSFEDLKEKGIGVKIDYRGMSDVMKDLIGCACIVGIVGMCILVCMYCPSLPEPSPTSDDDFMTGFMWSHILNDCGCDGWGSDDWVSDDWCGGSGLVS